MEGKSSDKGLSSESNKLLDHKVKVAVQIESYDSSGKNEESKDSDTKTYESDGKLRSTPFSLTKAKSLFVEE